MARIAFVVDQMFEDSEFRFPYDRVRAAGHEAVIVGRDKDAKLEGKKGNEVVTADVSVDEVQAADFDALVVPGGYSPDKLREDARIVAFTKEIAAAGKPIAAICHAGWLLAEADLVRGRTVTSYPSIRTDLVNAGAKWVDEEVVEDGNLITSRRPDDLEAFTTALLARVERPSVEA